MGPSHQRRSAALATGRLKRDFIELGKPVQNAFVESFNGRLRDECLNAEVFFTLADVRDKLKSRRRDLDLCPSSANRLVPREFLKHSSNATGFVARIERTWTPYGRYPWRKLSHRSEAESGRLWGAIGKN